MANGNGEANGNEFELEPEFTSRFKQTSLFVKGGKAFFGLWNPPPVRIDGDEERIRVEDGREGQLDLIAFEVYGDRALWWAIGQANQIDFPLEQVVPGLELIIPKLANVRAALLATVTRQGRRA